MKLLDMGAGQICQYKNIQLTQLGSSTVISSDEQELAILTDINSEQLTADHFSRLGAF